jgi:D-amino-acid dehydrogenase
VTNGGQISVAHAEPWANPTAPLKVLKWLARAAPSCGECTPGRTRHNIRQIVTLGLYSRASLQALRAETASAGA